MPRQQQMDIANQLMANGVYDMAARAYELYLHTYPSDGNRDQVELMLALVYTRYLGRKQRARELLRTAMPRLHDQGMKDLAQKLLTELPAT
jgi:outer membrane protein assembly factor BamD (BamD/ComL family)